MFVERIDREYLFEMDLSCKNSYIVSKSVSEIGK